jgi:enterochelin esterase-like enzyme
VWLVGVAIDGRGSMAAWNFKDDFWFNVTFVYRLPANDVHLVGDFNGWKVSDSFKMSLNTEENIYQLTLPLSEGFYHYKFLVDGEYKRDVNNPHIGGELGNSIMFVHMDPNVYQLRHQYLPHRTYQRGNWDGRDICTLLPSIPPDLACFGILQRQIFVYLPPSYYDTPHKSYPVVYTHDGQNIFSGPEDAVPWGGWQLDERLDKWWSAGSIPEFILVGIPNSDFVIIGNRQREYSTTDIYNAQEEPYIRYVVEVVKKEIDDNFRTLPDPSNTFTLGSSLGGLVSFLLALSLPGVFSCAICLSPAFWFVDSKNQTVYTLVENLTHRRSRVYIDSGDGDGDNKEVVRDMASLLFECGWTPDHEYMYHYDECVNRVPLGVTHSEYAWRDRVINGLKFAFKK